ncbi:replication initiation protein RepC [Agrobacterium sp. SHOUNA12C]|nr:plasmid replication protein RepC [Rhizobium rhizogenes]MCJ9721373.1 replication initiation protein RepC [Agrobacterium sp. BETTINA12B]MCJ9759765.1 replication initiation protein RepC [Agrobacterium sp. SHOUNA12C]NTF57147.1 replication initiation protein RepC [Rhizobium rhizogenes]NTF64052.1 replication initiation protein RepC [Rhizobium rhizogenes]NTF76729.1 replication initiation protein RepC [Rhizobium rhizogenes]
MEMHITTPFGRRSMSLALMRNQIKATAIRQGKTVDKWQVFRNVCEARPLLNISDRTLAVLNALLTFYPEKELSEDAGLVVFPSNNQLTVRAHGITGTTLRRHLAALVEAGLILRKDSPNGKRFARKDGAGAVEDAYGFNLAPLLARSEELADLAQQIAVEKKHLRQAKEKLTICRRDVRKLIGTAIEEGVPGNWQAIERHYLSLVNTLPRAPTAVDIAPIAEEMEMLRNEIINLLETKLISEKSVANDVQNDRHIQNSNTESQIESEASPQTATAPEPDQSAEQISKPSQQPIKAYPLATVLRACPEITNYGPSGAIASWRELMTAAVVVRTMLGVTSSAYQDACDTMGPESTAVVMACLLEKAQHISSAGGYLRNLTSRARRGEFSLGPMLMAQMRGRDAEARKAS